MIDAVCAAGLNLQGPRANERGDVGIAKEREPVFEFEVARNRKLVAFVAPLLDSIVTATDRNLDAWINRRCDERVIAAIRQTDHRDARGIDFRTSQEHVEAAADFGNHD